MKRRGPNQRGFSLLEVVVALSILAISLTVLLQSQAQSLASAGRSRDLTVATLLARSKMVDVEQKLFHDGFTANTQTEDGDFAEEGFAEIKWKTTVDEVQLDLAALEGLCASRAKDEQAHGASADGQKQTDCGSAMASLTGQVGGLMEELSRSMRAVEVEVWWNDGPYKENLRVRALLTRDDFQTEQETEVMRGAGALQKAGVNLGGATQGLGGGGAGASTGAP